MKKDNTKRVLQHLARLRREGEALVHYRPLDELPQAMWSHRVEKYLAKEFPESKQLSVSDLIEVKMPNLLDLKLKKSHPLDAAVARAQMGQQLIRRQLALIASKAEQLELKRERTGT